jgi:hypothetical protein
MISTSGRGLLLAAAICGLLPTARGATDIAAEPGFSGFFTLGASAASAASNRVSIDSDNDRIDSIDDAPPGASTVMPAIRLSLTYTFGNRSTELFLGDSIEDFVRFDFATLLGVRHKVEGAGIFEIVAVQTPFATDVWADPYAVGVSRDETGRSADGIRLQWGRIFGSGFDVRVSSRNNRIDNENSGDQLRAANLIGSDEQRMLNRNGDINRASLVYNWYRGRGEAFSLSASYYDYDLDGRAMAFDGYSLQFSDVSLLGPRLRLATNVLLGRNRNAGVNPLYGVRNDSKLAALTLTLFVSEPFGASGWVGSATLAYAHDDNSIDFYDTTASYVNFGLIRRF